MKQSAFASKNNLLGTLCLLTFIGSGFGLSVSLLSIININFIQFAQNIIGYTSVQTNTQDANFSFVYIIVKGILYAFVLYSAYLMFYKKAKGFFLYIIGQFLLIVISFIFFPYPLLEILSIVIPEIIFSIAFILLYALHFKSME